MIKKKKTEVVLDCLLLYASILFCEYSYVFVFCCFFFFCICVFFFTQAAGSIVFFFFFQAEDGIRDFHVTGVQTCALPISRGAAAHHAAGARPRAAGGRRG